MFQSGDLVNPTRRSLFSQRMLEKKESVYASRRKAPLGNIRHMFVIYNY